MAVNLSEDEIQATAQYRGNNPPTSFEPVGRCLKLIEIEDKNTLKIKLKPFEPVGVKLVYK